LNVFKLYSIPESTKRQPQRPSKIFAMLGCYQGFLLDNLRRRRPFSLKGQLEIADGPVNGLGFFDKRDDSHLASAGRIETTGFAGKHEEMPHIWFSACLLLEGRGKARRQRKGKDFQLLLSQSLLSWDTQAS